MTDLRTRYLGLDLKNPVIVGSSGLTQTLDGVQRCAEAGAGAVVLKSIFEEEIESRLGQLAKSSAPAIYLESEEYLARYGREDAIATYLELIAQAKRAVPVPVIASINCVSAGGWIDFATRIEEAGADALELNVFLLPSDPRQDPRAIEATYFEVARGVVRSVSLPVALKVGPYFSAVSRTLVELSRTGLRGLVLFNRFFRIDLDVENLALVPGPVLSSPEEMVVPLRWISILSRQVSCDLAATTGVHDGIGVVKQLLAGAAAVQVCSTLYKHEVPYLGVMLREVAEWMERHGHASVSDFRGRLSQAAGGNPAEHERVQFMRTTSAG
jgi:dihydroorotate dehydrogenase (fumarate)